MRESIATGLTFGTTSGVITTLGLMVGLHAGTESRLVVIGAIVTIAIADALSDGLGIHISEEGEGIHTEGQIWTATIVTVLTKFLMAMTFLIPVLLFTLTMAIWVSIGWGAIVLTALSYRLASRQKKSRIAVIAEHLLVAALVIVITHSVGDWVAVRFSQ